MEDLSPIHMWRRTEYYDVPSIKRLINNLSSIKGLFGEIDVLCLIERSYLSLTQVAKDGSVVSFIALSDHPNVLTIPASEWLFWLKQKYNLEQATIRNTLFVHFLVWDLRYTYAFLNLILDSVFLSFIYLQHIVIIVPQNAAVPEFILELFMQMTPVDAGDASSVQKILLCLRQRHVNRLKIRFAVEEDNEDLMPILDSTSSRFRELYGNYLISELVAYKHEQRELLVAERAVADRAVGLMSLHKYPNVELLNEHFELAPFYGLKKLHEEDKAYKMDKTISKSNSLEDIISSLLLNESDLMALRVAADEVSLPMMEMKKDSEPVLTISDDDTVIFADQVSSAFDKVYESHMKDDYGAKVTADKKILPDKSSLPQGFQKSQDKSKEIVVKEKHSFSAPKYHGAANAFVIEVFALHEDVDERRSFDFLLAAFECFSDLDYCILTLPPEYPVFAFLEHFVRVTPRCFSKFPHELYVAHKNALFSHMLVRAADRTDHVQINLLLKGMSKHRQIQLDYHSSVNYPFTPYSCYVFISEKRIVGLIIISKYPYQSDVEYLRYNYRIDDFIVFECHQLEQHGFIKHLVLSPIFEKHTRYFLKEVHRLSGYTCLHYPIYEGTVEYNNQEESLMSMLGQMIPVLPRRKVEYNLENLDESSLDNVVVCRGVPFALYHMNKRLCSLPKTEVNYRIVIIGASDTTLGFLEKILFGPTCAYLTFNNITLVDPHGLPGDIPPTDNMDERMLPQTSHFSYRYMNNICLRSYVNVVFGKMTKILRNKKQIKVNNETVLSYDYLLLFCGKVYKIPRRREILTYGGQTCYHNILEPQSSDELDKGDNNPKNVFCLNSLVDASNAVILIKEIVKSNSQDNIIVYGWGSEAHCCIECLLTLGVSGCNIVLIEPTPDDAPTLVTYNNRDVEEAVQKTLQDLGVKVYHKYYFTNWTLTENKLTVVSVSFESRTRQIDIKCAAMFCFGEKQISDEIMQALKKAFIVTDKHVVINKNFETNDCHIFAAGTITKYPRHYYAKDQCHSHFNSVEVGNFVAEHMLKLWDPTRDNDELQSMEKGPNLPSFAKPIVVNCKLPGNINYLKVRKPGIEIPLEAVCTRQDYGNVLVTGNCNNGQGYFRLHVNNLGCIETITCYTNKKINVGNLLCLYGSHESLFDQLLLRFEAGHIIDFYTYFSKPWMHALFHEGFADLKTLAKQFFAIPLKFPGVSIAEDVRRAFAINNWEKLSDKTFQEMRIAFRSSDARMQIEYLVMKFLEHHSHDLPMYATYHMIKMLLGSCEDNFH